MEKLLTVEDIAQMTSLTTRTIRNYLKDGSLKGRKIGGQWRFTKEDISNFMENGKVAQELSGKFKEEILDFVNGVNTDYVGEIQVCTIVDLYLAREVIEERRDKVLALIGDDDDGYRRCTYDYIEEEQKGRLALFAPPDLIIKALEILK